jgi:hypothetical protein
MLVGDPRQLIYAWRGSNKTHIVRLIQELKCKVVVLDTNFRSTREIVAMANACSGLMTQLMTQLTGPSRTEHKSAVDLAFEPVPMKSMSNVGDEYLGPKKPLVVDFVGGFDDEIRFVVQHITRLMNGYQPYSQISLSDISIVVRSNYLLNRVQSGLFKAGIPCVVVSQASQPTSQTRRVQLMTIHGAKGLESLAVYLMGVSSKGFPDPKGSNHLEDERNLFYVAITRARRFLVITHSAKFPSLLIAELEPRDLQDCCARWVFDRVNGQTGELQKHILLSEHGEYKHDEQQFAEIHAEVCKMFGEDDQAIQPVIVTSLSVDVERPVPVSAAELLRFEYVRAREKNTREPDINLTSVLGALQGFDFVRLKRDFFVPDWREQVLAQLSDSQLSAPELTVPVVPVWAEDLKPEILDLLHLVCTFSISSFLNQKLRFPKLETLLAGKRPYGTPAGLFTVAIQSYADLQRRCSYATELNLKDLTEFWNLVKVLAMDTSRKMALHVEVDQQRLFDLLAPVNNVHHMIVSTLATYVSASKTGDMGFEINSSVATPKLRAEIVARIGQYLILSSPQTAYPQPDSVVLDIARAHATLALWKSVLASSLSSSSPESGSVDYVVVFDLVSPRPLVLDFRAWPVERSERLLYDLTSSDKKRKR